MSRQAVTTWNCRRASSTGQQECDSLRLPSSRQAQLSCGCSLEKLENRRGQHILWHQVLEEWHLDGEVTLVKRKIPWCSNNNSTAIQPMAASRHQTGRGRRGCLPRDVIWGMASSGKNVRPLSAPKSMAEQGEPNVCLRRLVRGPEMDAPGRQRQGNAHDKGFRVGDGD
jgi:hypothetical protein